MWPYFIFYFHLDWTALLYILLYYIISWCLKCYVLSACFLFLQPNTALFFNLSFQVVCLSILVADLLVYSLYLSPVAIYYLPVRIAPYIRVILFILSIRYHVLILLLLMLTYVLSACSSPWNVELSKALPCMLINLFFKVENDKLLASFRLWTLPLSSEGIYFFFPLNFIGLFYSPQP